MAIEFKLLKENPSDLDELDSGSHQRLSDSLYHIIQTQEGGMTIGLEGDWGSGKSTIIKILGKRFVDQQESNQRDLFFVFDAWAHDGDPLKRVFLDDFIENIEKQTNNLDKRFFSKEDKKQINEIKLKITGSYKKITTTTGRRISPFGQWLTFSALLFTLGAAFLGSIESGRPCLARF